MKAITIDDYESIGELTWSDKLIMRAFGIALLTCGSWMPALGVVTG